MENPYGLTAFQLFSVAISGPLSNLLAAIVLAALTHWDILPFLLANEAIRINLMLFLFNLLPVLPLDGGRILYCILQRPLGRTKAMRFGIHLGRSFSGFLACIAICIFFHYGKLNLSLIFSAVFILLSAQDEKDALMQSTLTQLCPSEDIPLPARIYQVKTETTIASALSLLRPKEACWFLLSKDKQPVGIVSGQALLEYLKHDGSCYAKLSELPRYQLSLSKQC